MYVHNCEDLNKPMTIRISYLLEKKADRDFHRVRKMLQNILLEFSLPGLPAIGQDGSAGRLLYETGNSCPGSHIPRNTTSDAVMQHKNPFSKHRKTCCLSLVELPSDGGQIHGNFLERFHVRIEQTGCTMHLCGDQFGCPVRYGEPYVLIIGGPQAYQQVDRAVRIVKRQIELHQRNCSCTLHEAWEEGEVEKEQEPEHNANDELPLAEVTCGSARSLVSNDKNKPTADSVSQSVTSVADQKSVDSSSHEPGEVIEEASQAYSDLEPIPQAKTNGTSELSPRLEHQFLRTDSTKIHTNTEQSQYSQLQPQQNRVLMPPPPPPPPPQNYYHNQLPFGIGMIPPPQPPPGSHIHSSMINVPPPPPPRPRADSMEEAPTKKAKQSLEDTSENYHRFEITLPLWLQKNKQSRDKLFCKFLTLHDNRLCQSNSCQFHPFIFFVYILSSSLWLFR